ncbi:MAG TPA: hypothetical protein VHZ09_14355 [Acidobacteriaceae bacterium]|jgi:hypothetical protein|nr:hypothetical protein [Acidobacteriaceae bacterium]
MSTTNESQTNPAAPKPETKRRCRSLTVAGVQCNSTAIRGHDLCHTHKNYRYPVCPKKGTKIAIPLLEDFAAIRLVLTQTAHGLFSGDVEPAAARSVAYICQIAASTLPRPYRASRPVDEGKPVITEPVTEITTGPDGHPLGPEEKYVGPGGVFEPYWSFTKYLYEQECESLGKPKPTCVEDMPPSGWMGEEEYTEDPAQWTARYRDRMDRMKEEKDRRDAQAGRPAPHPRPRCSQGIVVCRGPEGLPRCYECDQIAWKKEEKEEEEEAKARANNPDQPIGDLKAVASPATGSRPPAPSPRLPAPNSLLPTPNSQLPTPNSRRVIKLATPPNANIPNTCPGASPRGVPGCNQSRGVSSKAAPECEEYQ